MPITVRELTPEDVGAFAALSDAIESDHATSMRITGPGFLEILALPGSVFLGGFEGDRLRAWSGFFATPPHAGSQRFLLDGDAHPEALGRGIGTRMLGAALDLARDRHRRDASRGTAVYLYRGPLGRTTQTALLAEHGLVPDRFRFLMVADLATPGDPPALPGGLPADLPADLDVAGFVPARSEAVRAAHNAAFADYPNAGLADRGSWEAYLLDAPHARHALSVVASDPAADGTVAAYVLAHEYDAPVSGRAGVTELYLPYLGTRPGYRGRGLASQLLGHTLRAARAAGYDTVALDVDAENPTGALGVYERAGFRVERQLVEYALRESAGAAGE
jgi:ribosomal protein S18 acetylase RimI-like enzyme